MGIAPSRSIVDACKGVLKVVKIGISSSRQMPDALHGEEAVDRTARLSFRRARGQVQNSLRDLVGYLPLYRAAVEGEWKDARKFFEQDPEALTAKITIASETALHIAVGTGQAMEFVQKLVDQMSTENLALTDQHGETALSVAAAVGNIEAAKILINKNPDLPNISGKFGYPIHRAARFGHEKMVVYLMRKDVTRSDIEPNPFSGEMGGRLLIDVIAADFFDIALKLVDLYPEMATVEPNGLGSPLSVLARKPTAFSSGRATTRWSYVLFSGTSVYGKGPKRMLMECRARDLVKALCKEILELDDAKIFLLLQQPLHDAAKLGIPEIIEEIVDAFPPAIWFMDKENYNVFQLAVMNRRIHVFNLIYQMTDFKCLITSYVDPQENNMLHLVAKLPPSDRLNFVSGPAFLVQREMRWFQEVAKLVQPAYRLAKNNRGKTPEMVFREAHKDLMKEGVKWTKHTTTSSTVFATLIATVAFAGGMHAPEGTTNGLRVLNYQQIMTIFIIADAISLIFSVISIITFLSIIISRYSEVDFLLVFPQRLYFGLSALFVSINTMLLAFGVALYLRLGPTTGNSQIPLIIVLILLAVAFVPALFPVIRYWNERRRFRKKSTQQLH